MDIYGIKIIDGEYFGSQLFSNLEDGIAVLEAELPEEVDGANYFTFTLEEVEEIKRCVKIANYYEGVANVHTEHIKYKISVRTVQ